jgi:hypothetical protein
VCHGGVSAGSMVLMQGPYSYQQFLYDVSDPVHPRLLCTMVNTSVHLFTGDTFEYLKPVSATETDVILHSLGSGNETVAGTFPFYANTGGWLADQSVMVYSLPVPPDNADFSNGGVAVYLYARQQASLLFRYPIPATDCICRFGFPPPVLDVSPDGQYVVAGWPIGKGGNPLVVYRVSDRTVAIALDSTVTRVLWDRGGHRLFLSRDAPAGAQSWTPESGVTNLGGAAAWSYLPGESPDGGEVAYTAYLDPPAMNQLRVYAYDLKAATTRMLVDKLRSQVLFVKDGWVWYLEEATCDPMACGAPWGTQPTGKVFAMQLPTGTETQVVFAAGDNPVMQGGRLNSIWFGPGEFWPPT